MNILFKPFIVFGIASLFAASCTTSPDPQTPPQTRILKVKIEPNPVAVGDTAKFTCIIEDSLDERFRFAWNFDRSSDQDTITKVNSVEWIAPDTAASFNQGVNVTNGSQDSLPAGRSFNISVVEN